MSPSTLGACRHPRSAHRPSGAGQPAPVSDEEDGAEDGESEEASPDSEEDGSAEKEKGQEDGAVSDHALQDPPCVCCAIVSPDSVQVGPEGLGKRDWVWLGFLFLSRVLT